MTFVIFVFDGRGKSVRFIGIDYGTRRIGLALSDPSGTLASPWRVLERPRSELETLQLVADCLERLSHDDERVEQIVVGWPRRLDGRPTDQTSRVEAFARALGERTSLPVILQDERLSSVEAESRLALREPDWRRRKPKLDAASAAVLLQDFLDAQPRQGPREEDPQ